MYLHTVATQDVEVNFEFPLCFLRSYNYHMNRHANRGGATGAMTSTFYNFSIGIIQINPVKPLWAPQV